MSFDPMLHARAKRPRSGKMSNKNTTKNRPLRPLRATRGLGEAVEEHGPEKEEEEAALLRRGLVRRPQVARRRPEVELHRAVGAGLSQ